jgi:site-specific DNA-methyltransferase (adenine-specific)
MGKEWDGGDIAFRVETWRLCFELLKDGGHLLAFSGTRTYHRMAVAIEDAGFEIRDQIGWLYGSGFPKSHNISKAIDKINGAEREVVGTRLTNVGMQGGNFANKSAQGEIEITAAASEEAKEWEGWGTALKPAWEPVVVARKPISEKSIAANVLKHGTGAINIDGCRVGEDLRINQSAENKDREKWRMNTSETNGRESIGRWPANVIHDGSEEVIAAFPEDNLEENPSRFFYSAKAQEEDRMGSKHPTVKPIDLMAYLCRMVTPPNGHVLDPFAGSGSTGIGAIREGFHATLIEREPEYFQDILNRTRHIKGEDLPLFNDEKELL